MPLPNSAHFPKEAGPKRPPAQKTRYKSYSQAVKADRQVSLIHEHIKKPHIDEPSQKKTLNSRIYKTSRSKGAYLFDISVCRDHYSDLQSMMLLKEQYPNVYACVPLNDGPRRYLEVYITKKDDSSNILENGLYFKESNLVVYPCTALPDSAKILKIKLSNLPMLPKDEVLAGLRQSLTLFGNIIDVGIAAEPNTGLFMGTGYEVLNVEQAANKENKFLELSHQLSWCESESEVLHATWQNMPTWCRYCHKEGHTKFDCPLSKARIICYSCHQQGHRSFECPRPT
jgi:hypothetical protein